MFKLRCQLCCKTKGLFLLEKTENSIKKGFWVCFSCACSLSKPDEEGWFELQEPWAFWWEEEAEHH